MVVFPALALVRDSNPRLTYSATVDAVLARLRQDLERVADLGAEGRSFEELIGDVRSATNRTGLEALRAAMEMLDTRTAAVERDGVRLRFRGTAAKDWLRMRGQVVLVRYADDFVIAFEREDDARRVMDVLPKLSCTTLLGPRAPRWLRLRCSRLTGSRAHASRAPGLTSARGVGLTA